MCNPCPCGDNLKDCIHCPCGRVLTDEPCPHCHGEGGDPNDDGDYDYAVGMYDPYSRGPCPECNGTGKKAT